MKNFITILTTRQNNIGLFFQVSVFALFAKMTLLSSQVSAQQTCTPTTTVTEGDLAPGGTVSFAVTSGSGSVTVDHVNAGSGLQSLSLVGAPSNAVVMIPAFTPGTFNPVTATFTVINIAQPVDFTLRAASTYHAANIRVGCLVAPPGCTRTQGYWKNHEEDWSGPITLGTRSYTEAQLLSIFRQPVRGNGLISLAHQLIAAKINIASGASVPLNVQNAINAADALIGNLVVGGNNGGYLSPAVTSMLTEILDQYNNGDSPGGPPHCDD
jgi:hypothetical protein